MLWPVKGVSGDCLFCGMMAKTDQLPGGHRAAHATCSCLRAVLQNTWALLIHSAWITSALNTDATAAGTILKQDQAPLQSLWEL